MAWPSLRRAAAAMLCLGFVGLFSKPTVSAASSQAHVEGQGGQSAQDTMSKSPSALRLAASYVSLDISYLRWMWWPWILYSFWGMAHVCDVYFIRTIDVISERFSIPDDVAGATLMALGCNGPEMALNTIAIFHPSSIGVGAVIGGEVFNVLVIIGTALLATPEEYLPLKLSQFNFFRDVLFYVLSVAALYWVLSDGQVTQIQALLLLAGAVIYTLTVVFSSKISDCLFFHLRAVRMTRTTTRRLSRSPANSSRSRGEEEDEKEESEEEIPEPDPETVRVWSVAAHSADPSQGSVLGVRVDVRNRLMDRCHRVDQRFVWLADDVICVSTALDPMHDRHLSGASTPLVYEHGYALKDHHWHQGGLVNQPIFFGGGAREEPPAALGAVALEEASTSTSRALLPPGRKASIGVARPAALALPGLAEAPLEIIPVEDVLYCEATPFDQRHFALHVHQHDSELGSLLTLEFSTSEPEVCSAWVSHISGVLKNQRRRTAEAPPFKSPTALLLEWAEWLQFPVKFWLRMTIPDMDDPRQQRWYPVSFFMSMAWLALFAYSVVAACDGIHADFGISVSVLGFTVAAAGTSFPNVFSGMVVARQGKTSMAIANALGANVQNVFLALAVPWTVQTCLITRGPFPLVVHGLSPAVAECVATLVPVVVVFHCCSSMPRWAGWLFLLTYLVYLFFALGQQVTDCVRWPFPCA